MLKSRGKDPVEREKQLRRGREKISQVPGKVKVRRGRAQMERWPFCGKKDISSPVTSRKEEKSGLDAEEYEHLIVGS